MPNQRAIAAELGLTQATVSLALRNNPAISPETRQKVCETAERLGYRPNAYVSSLMARIRTGRSVTDKGCIAVLFDCASTDGLSETYKLQFDGIVKKATSLGFHAEPFYLRSKEISSAHFEKMLYARGIVGVILMGLTNHSGEGTSLNWARYSTAAVAYDWTLPWLDRVATHHRHNVELAFRKVREHGYRKIGMCLPPEGWAGVDSSWRAGFYLAMDEIPKSLHIPPFVGKPGVTPLAPFERWLKKWRPEALVCLIGHELEYLKQLNLKVPEDIGIACVNRPLDSIFSGVEENHGQVGETVAELVISGILRNDYGPPSHSKLILIEGSWADGHTLRNLNS